MKTNFKNHTNLSDSIANQICEQFELESLTFVGISRNEGRFNDEYRIYFNNRNTAHVTISEEEYNEIEGEDSFGQLDFLKMGKIIAPHLD